MSARARLAAKSSRSWPPAYISATTPAASVSPKASAAEIERPATRSSPTSPRASERDDLAQQRRRARRPAATPQINALKAAKPQQAARRSPPQGPARRRRTERCGTDSMGLLCRNLAEYRRGAMTGIKQSRPDASHAEMTCEQSIACVPKRGSSLTAPLPLAVRVSPEHRGESHLPAARAAAKLPAH